MGQEIGNLEVLKSFRDFEEQFRLFLEIIEPY